MSGGNVDSHREYLQQALGRISRREFLRHGATAAAGLALSGSVMGAAGQLFAQDAPAPAGDKTGLEAIKLPKSRVVVITHPEAIIRDYLANRPLLEKMIEQALRELTGADSELKAWQQVVTTPILRNSRLWNGAGHWICVNSPRRTLRRSRRSSIGSSTRPARSRPRQAQ